MPAAALCMSMLVTAPAGTPPSPAVFEIMKQVGSGEDLIGHVWVELTSTQCVEHWTLEKTGTAHATINGSVIRFNPVPSSPTPPSLAAFHALSSSKVGAPAQATLTTYDNVVLQMQAKACAEVGTCTRPLGGEAVGGRRVQLRQQATRTDPPAARQIDTGVVFGLKIGPNAGTKYGYAYAPPTTASEFWIFDTEAALRTPSGDADDWITFETVDTIDRTWAEFKNCTCSGLAPAADEVGFQITTTVGTYSPT